MNKNIEEIYNKLPSSWADLKFRDFKKILDLPVSEDDEFEGLFNGQDNSIKTLSVLSGIPVNELYEMDLISITVLTNRIAFIVNEPDPNSIKSSLQWKKIDKVSYGDYITFVTLSQEPFKNMDLLMQAFSSVELSTQEIGELSMLEVYAGFFTLNQLVEKFMKNLVRKTAMQVAVLQMKESIVIPFKQSLTRLRQRFKKRTAGTSQ